MAEISIQDRIQQFANTLVFYKGKPVKVKQIGNQIKLLNLITQRTSVVDFHMKDFSPPLLRLGYVNIDETAVYVSRTHQRLYTIGINNVNCKFKIPRDTHCPNNKEDVISKVSLMECPEFATMLYGHYPSLEEAYKEAKEFNGFVAFDKQFAVDSSSAIYYKNAYVGSYNGKEIKFEKQFEYLNILLGNGYEKASRTFKEKAN